MTTKAVAADVTTKQYTRRIVCDVPGCGLVVDPTDPTIVGRGLNICDRHGGIRDKETPTTAPRTSGFQDSADGDDVRRKNGIKVT